MTQLQTELERLGAQVEHRHLAAALSLACQVARCYAQVLELVPWSHHHVLDKTVGVRAAYVGATAAVLIQQQQRHTATTRPSGGGASARPASRAGGGSGRGVLRGGSGGRGRSRRGTGRAQLALSEERGVESYLQQLEAVLTSIDTSMSSLSATEADSESAGGAEEVLSGGGGGEAGRGEDPGHGGGGVVEEVEVGGEGAGGGGGDEGSTYITFADVVHYLPPCRNCASLGLHGPCVHVAMLFLGRGPWPAEAGHIVETVTFGCEATGEDVSSDVWNVDGAPDPAEGLFLLHDRRTGRKRGLSSGPTKSENSRAVRSGHCSYLHHFSW